MERIRGYEQVPERCRGAVVALGNFDGVHRGHQALIALVRTIAREAGAPAGVVTFEPHPRRFFQPDAPPFRLTIAEEKARILAALGLDVLFELTFDAALAGMEAEDFVARVLVEGLGISHLVIGADFRFGRARRGDVRLLREMGARLGFGVTVSHLVGGPAGEYSSTAIRVLLEQGRVEEAAAQLGRWHTIRGRVRRGDRRGRALGFPTANLDFGEQLVPRFGIYASRVEVLEGPHQGTWQGVASIGVRPTFGGDAPNFEVHLFDFAGDLYGTDIAGGLVSWLREERRFETVEALVAQMKADAAAARHRLAHARIPD